METNKFDKTVLKQVWNKVFKMIKLITGEVDYKNKGTLQEQINSKKLLNSTVATAVKQGSGRKLCGRGGGGNLFNKR